MSMLQPLESDPFIDRVPAYRLVQPREWTTPVVLGSPHSGRYFPPRFWQLTDLAEAELRQCEDSFVDELFGRGPDFGMPLLKSVYARSWLDLNREPFELDPRMFSDALPDKINSRSPRVACGLGTIARIVGKRREIYRRKLRFTEALERIETVHRPYHRALAKTLRQTRERFGCSLLLDCHSMPTLYNGSDRDAPAADIVLGDRFGTTCSIRIVDRVEEILRGLGYRVIRNSPYAGGYITQRHGMPGENRHAIQIEISRHLYMDEQRFRKSQGFDRLRENLSIFLSCLAEDSSALAA